jgi:hypothetical protein
MRQPHGMAENLHAVEVGQAQVQQDTSGDAASSMAMAARRYRRCPQREVRIHQHGIGEPAQEFRFVFDDQHLDSHLSSGNECILANAARLRLCQTGSSAHPLTRLCTKPAPPSRADTPGAHDGAIENRSSTNENLSHRVCRAGRSFGLSSVAFRPGRASLRPRPTAATAVTAGRNSVRPSRRPQERPPRSPA